MNKFFCFQIFVICFLIGCSYAVIGVGTPAHPISGPGNPNIFGNFQLRPNIGRRKRLLVPFGWGVGPGSALNFGVAQSAGGIQGRRRKRFAANFGTAQSAGGIQG